MNMIMNNRSWKKTIFQSRIFQIIFPAKSKRFKITRSFYHKFKYWKNNLIILRKRKLSTYDDFISVIIPVFDRTEILEKCIQSILKQSYKQFELIIVSDGSPLETLEIIKKYEKENSKIRVFYFYNNSGNAIRGRNKGIKEARGNYIAFQDSDDVAEPDRLKISLQYIKSFNVDVVYGGWRAIVDGSRDIDYKNNDEVFSRDCDLETLQRVNVLCQSTVMAKKSSLLAVGGYKEKMHYREDHELWMRLAFYGYKFKSINKILTNLRLHNKNLEIELKENDDHWLFVALSEYKILNKMKPKIGYIIPGTGIAGGIAVICEHTNRLLKRGYDVTIIAEDNKSEISWFPNQMVEVIPICEIQNNYDILIATGWSTAYYLGIFNANRKIYFVQSDESRFFDKDDPNFKKVIKTYEMDLEFMTEAKWIKEWLFESFDKKAFLVPNGLNNELFHVVEPIEPKSSRLRVLLEGAIDIPYKGMEDVFKVVNEIDCEVWCVSSSGRPKKSWKCDRLFLEVPLNEMKYIYSSCDILLKMSRVEGFFGPPLEMMACGGTVVVGRVTGYDEYIIDGYNALVVDQGDIQGAINAINRLIYEPEFREHLISNGAKTVKNWQWENSIDQLEEFYIKPF